VSRRVPLTLAVAGTAALAPAAEAAAPVGSGVWRAAGRDGLVTITVRKGVVERVRVEAPSFTCDPFGDIGPFKGVVRPAARVRSDRTVSFSARVDEVDRLAFRASFRRDGTVVGRWTGRGTIATGQPCTTGTRRFVARRR
jgi:hypothetical protein